MATLIEKFLRSIRQNGVRGTMQRVIARLRQSAHSHIAVTSAGKRDILGHYAQILGTPHGDPSGLASVPDNRLQWVIPNFGFGSGGHLNIFRFINMLAEQGFDQRLVIVPPYSWDSAAAARKAIDDWYFPLNAEVALGVEGFAPAAVTLATSWQTAYHVAKHRASRDRFYFVQDFEPSFYSVSSDYYLAENTYRLGLKGITAGTWLSEKLAADYGMRCGALSFGVEHDRYFQHPRHSQGHFNLLFYSRHVTPRRLFELGLLALARVCANHPEVVVIFVGGDVGGIDIPFPHLNAGEQPLSALPDLYSQSDLALVLSGTNLSLLPLEVSACGCPVVMNDTPCARWLLGEDAAFFAAPDPEALAAEISRAIASPQERQARVARAQQIAAIISWQDQGARCAEILRDLRDP